MKIYISGPMTGMPDLNAQAFTNAETQLRLMGYEPVNPHKNGVPVDATWEDHMRARVLFIDESGWYEPNIVMECQR